MTSLPTQQQMESLAAALDTIGAYDLARYVRVVPRTLVLPQGEQVDRLAELERRVAELERNQRTDTRGLGGGMDPAQVERVTFPLPAVHVKGLP